MLLRTVCRAMAILAASLLMLISASSAAAQSSQGALVERIDRCDTFDTVTVCMEGRVVFNTTTTPSGQISTVVHTDATSTIDTPYCHDVQTMRYTQHGLFEPGDVIQVSHYISHNTSRGQCDGGPLLACTYDVLVHSANGQNQIFRTEFSCVPEAT